MRFTAQEEYGLRCLLQVAREPGGFTTVPAVARREGLTRSYVGPPSPPRLAPPRGGQV